MKKFLALGKGVALLACAIVLPVHAGAPADQAQRLKGDLTPFGAEKAGNADGSIPAWSGGFTTPTPGDVPGGRRADPFKDDKPQFSVTAKNMAQYAGNVSSVAGRKTFPNHVAYVGTKFAVHGLSENLREELSSHNVRVITIAPGAVETELLSHTTDGAIKTGYQAWKQDMGGTVLSAEDVASAIAYAYQQPQNVCIREIVMAATRQQS